MNSSAFLDHVGLDMHGHRKKTRFFIDALERHRARDGRERSELRVLELGCGNGHVVSLPLAEAGFDVTGIDFHEESIEAARAANPFPHARFVVGDVRDFVARAGYDAVILSDILEHVDEPADLLSIAGRSLAANGLLLVAIPNGYGPYEVEQWLQRHGLLTPFLSTIRLLGRLRRRRSGGEPENALAYNAESGHVQHFTQRRFLALLQAAGFRPLEQRNGSLFGGELSQYAYRAVPGLVSAALRLADRLPATVVSTWYFACAKREDDGER